MPATLKETTSIKLDKESKEKAKLIFKELGITMGDAFNMFLSQVNLHQGMPFEVKIPNGATKKVIKEARQGENVDDFSHKDLFKLAGQIEFREDFNHKEDRVMRHDSD